MLFIITPACKEYSWGGNGLKNVYGKSPVEETAAETWELSCHPDIPNVIATGDRAGQTLSAYLDATPAALGEVPDLLEGLSLRIKRMDTEQIPSVPLLPDDDCTLCLENNKMWYIIDAKPGAALYYGFKETTTPEQLRTAIQTRTVCDLLNKVAVKPGDAFFIEAGTPHAIGAGLLVAEVQQSGSTPCQVFDPDSTDVHGIPRKPPCVNACEVFPFQAAPSPRNFGEHLVRCQHFTVDSLSVRGKATRKTTGESFHALLLLDGSLRVESAGQSLQAEAGNCIFVGADTGNYTLHGQGTVLITYMERWRYRIGIDLGGTGIKAGIVDPNNQIVSIAKRPTGAQRSWQEVIADMADTAREALRTAHLTLEDCDYVGVGSPGTIDPDQGRVVYSNNLRWVDVPLAATLQQHLGLPVQISNDANCATLGEVVAGAARGCRSAVLLTLGTGVGGGIVLDGKLFEGGTGAVELGHVTLIADGEPCTCGRRGCIESYCSATALIREANRAADASPYSLLAKMRADNGTMNGIIPFSAMAAGDETAHQVIDQYIRWLGEAITNFVNIFRPEVVLLSGGICGQGDVLTKPLNAFVQTHAFGGAYVPAPPILIATLGNDAGILGAANLLSDKGKF